jgi:hypothetical protein
MPSASSAVNKSKQKPQLCAGSSIPRVDFRNATGGACQIVCSETWISFQNIVWALKTTHCRPWVLLSSCPQPPSLAALNSAASNCPFSISSASIKLLLLITCAAFTGPFLRVKPPFVFRVNPPHDTFEIDPGFSLLSMAPCPLSLSAPGPRSCSAGFVD